MKRWTGMVLIVSCLLLATGTVAFGWRANQNPDSRIAPVLRDEAAFLRSNPQYDYEIPVIIKVRRDHFREADARHRNQVRNDGSETRSLGLVRSFAARVQASQIESLADSPFVEYITLDARVFSTRSEVSQSAP
ncbi:MAG TPA: hypothetical protein VMY18_04535, partial [Acidobacteriota bacterium]|nr:hypothetical protein [Acidobacteriota bacterium]